MTIQIQPFFKTSTIMFLFVLMILTVAQGAPLGKGEEHEKNHSSQGGYCPSDHPHCV